MDPVQTKKQKSHDDPITTQSKPDIKGIRNVGLAQN